MAKQIRTLPSPHPTAAIISPGTSEAPVSKKLTLEQIEERRKEVSELLGGIKVHAFAYEETEEHGQVLAFLREPTLHVKLRALDSIGVTEKANNLFGTGSTLVDSLLIREYSDPRITSGNTDFDMYVVALAAEAVGLCKAATNIIKKK